MASNTSKTARASVRAGQSTGGALSVLGEYKYIIPLNGGKHAYVRNLTNGKTTHLRTDSDAFAEEIRVLSAAGHLSARTLGLKVPLYDPMVHYQQVRDTWVGLRTPDGK